jgi:hypothetical protein
MQDLRIADRIEITDALHRYIRGVDRCNWDLVRSSYHPDAYDDRGFYRGDIDGFIAHLVRRHKHVEQSMHVVGNMVFEFIDADSALVETYYVTYQRIGPGAGDSLLPFLRGAPLVPGMPVETEIVGRYIDHFTRRDGEWRIAHRLVLAEVLRGAHGPVDGGLPPHGRPPGGTATTRSSAGAPSWVCRNSRSSPSPPATWSC